LGHAWLGPQLAERIEFDLSLCGGGRSVLVLCFFHITFRLISLSRFDARPRICSFTPKQENNNADGD
jgi:hypothetical protein